MSDAAAELARFEELQTQLLPKLTDVFADRLAPRTVVVVPSLSFPEEELAKIAGVHRYEERMLCLLMLLRLPRTQVIYVTSEAVDPVIIDYFLHLLSGIPGSHARQRLKLLSCGDASDRPLSRKLLERPRMLERIRQAIAYPEAAHLTCFNATELERSLAVELGVPLYATDPALLPLGTKSGSRRIFRAAGVEMPPGSEGLASVPDIVEALAALKSNDASTRQAVVKLNDGFSGEGNAVFGFEGAPAGRALSPWIAQELPRRLRFEASAEQFESFTEKFAVMEGVVEAFVDGDEKCSPSVQCRITPDGKVHVISTHDQVLGGPSGQVFLGCTFPAAPEYRRELADIGDRVGRELASRGVVGRFGVDFVSVKRAGRWHHAAVEINLRKGGTTHTFLMLEYLTEGRYDLERGELLTRAGQPRVYYATDTLQDERYTALTVEDLIDIAVCEQLHFQASTLEGVVFHLLGALPEFGKVGLVAIAPTVERARAWYQRAVDVLDDAVS